MASSFNYRHLHYAECLNGIAYFDAQKHTSDLSTNITKNLKNTV